MNDLVFTRLCGCGRSNAPHALFCGFCGVDLRAARAASARSPHRFMEVKSATFTADDAMDVILVDSTAADVTIYLPGAKACPGKCLTVKKITAPNKVIFDGVKAEPHGSAATLTIAAPYGAETIRSDGTQWYVYRGL